MRGHLAMDPHFHGRKKLMPTLRKSENAPTESCAEHQAGPRGSRALMDSRRPGFALLEAAVEMVQAFHLAAADDNDLDVFAEFPMSHARKTRSRCGSLGPHRTALSFATSCRLVRCNQHRVP